VAYTIRTTGVCCALLAALPLAAYAQAEPAKPAEIAKTVDAFAGHWILKGTDSEPGAAPAALTATIDCRPAALGAAVSCQIAADVSGDHIEAATIIGYSPDERIVRWMEISSTGEYHDHRGPWNGDEIRFQPLAYSIAGETATELLAVSFPSAGRMRLKATTRTAAGDSVLDLTGTRDATAPK